VLGNPPYNAFAGTSSVEESGLVEAYKEGLQRDWGIRKFNLDDLYVRFFRIAERRIAEGTGRGVVCFISNHSWLSYPSFVVMRQRLVGEFDRIWVNNLNGSKLETGKLAPDGSPDPSVFSTEANREGIQAGAAVTLLVRRQEAADRIMLHRNLWGVDKRDRLMESLDSPDFTANYETASPNPANRFSLRKAMSAIDYASWPALPEISGLEPFSGVVEKRRGALRSLDRTELAQRMRQYFDPQTSFAELVEAGIGPVEDMAGFRASDARARLLRSETYSDENLRQLAVYPFETQWACHTNVQPIWNRSRPELATRAFVGNGFVVTRLRSRRPDEGWPIFWTPLLPGDHLLDPNAHPFPVLAAANEANLSAAARAWLAALGLPDPDANRDIAMLPWHHALAIGYAHAWLEENGDDIRQDWPRVPLPDNADLLRASAALGARVAALLDPDSSVPGVTAGTIDPVIRSIAVPTKRGGGAMTEADRILTAGWGHAGKGGAVMPGRGRIVTRDYAADEAATEAKSSLLGAGTNDVFLNADAYWRNIPEHVWDFAIGGYQVIKKFLSYREQPLLGRAASPAEIRYVRDMARRLEGLRLMAPDLDANYRSCAAAHRPLT
jgi:Type ISP C-terminal specificity domain